MPGKHTTSPLGRMLAAAFPDQRSVVRRARMVAGAVAAAAVLVATMMWVRSVSSPGPGPLMVQPAPVASTFSTAPASPPVPVLSPSASPSPPARRSVSPKAPSPTRKSPATVRKTSAPAQPAITAVYMVGASWNSVFMAALQLRNPGATARSWSIELRYDGDDGVRINQAWNATLTQRGDTTILSGGPLAPGATLNTGFQASKRDRDRVRPLSCTVNGLPCVMS